MEILRRNAGADIDDTGCRFAGNGHSYFIEPDHEKKKRSKIIKKEEKNPACHTAGDGAGGDVAGRPTASPSPHARYVSFDLFLSAARIRNRMR
jgi:hypothetical protein